MGHSEDDAVHKIQNINENALAGSAENFGASWNLKSSIELDLKK